MNMTERDWEIVLAEQREAFHALADSPEEPVYEVSNDWGNAIPKPPPIPEPNYVPGKKEEQIFRFIRVEKQTAKAKFYVTHETMTEIQGFWCPNAAVIIRDTDVVEVAHWCKVKIIQFV